MGGRRINYWSYDNSAKSSVIKAKKDEKLSQNDKNKKTLTYSTNIRLLEE